MPNPFFEELSSSRLIPRILLLRCSCSDLHGYKDFKSIAAIGQEQEFLAFKEPFIHLSLPTIPFIGSSTSSPDLLKQVSNP